ncbi:hypothetical protein [Microvirga sp. VF16]|uniref:hypothetical protein n=1 Tax=Microvirga sp. VF16 TaxID=2807101 RepID=UPI00193D22C1|nr:hypothetical protein [Microvirga sp. VF16]QRM30345.1 hypothetical protein JO965_04830 [Microvirga sp. VF16]
MDVLWANTTLQDWAVLGLIALVPVLMVLAIALIRNEIRRSAQHISTESPRPKALPLQLKTTETQRQQWRMGKQRHPRAIMDLTDDIESLLKRIKAGG